MSRILVVGEDALCCVIGEKLVEKALPNWSLASPSINTQGVTKLIPRLERYVEQARYVQPVLCIADTDGKCVLDLLADWQPPDIPFGFVLRLAISEAESWVLADRAGFAEFFNITKNKLPSILDDEPDPKRLLLSLVNKSRNRTFREELVSQSDMNKPGTGYNLHLRKFVGSAWNVDRARDHSPSLNRAFEAIHALSHNV